MRSDASAFPYSAILLLLAAAVASRMLLRAFTGIRAADAGLTALLGFAQIKYNPCDDADQNNDQYNVDHNFSSNHLLRAYSALTLLLVLPMIPSMNTTIAATATRPAIAAPTFSDAGAVMSVPTVYTR